MPAPQALHVKLAPTALYVPSEQASQAPETLVRPGAHTWHALADTLPAGADRPPAGHEMQLPSPVWFLNVPAGQATQAPVGSRK